MVDKVQKHRDQSQLKQSSQPHPRFVTRGLSPVLTSDLTAQFDDFFMEGMDYIWDKPRTSDKTGTLSSEATFLDVEADHVIEEGTNSWMMVHERSYSNESRQTAASEGSCLSTPSEGADGAQEWPQNTGVMFKDPLQANQMLFLQDLAQQSQYPLR